MPKRFADRDQTKLNLQDGNFKPGQTVLKGCGMQAVYEKEIFYIKTPCSRIILKNNDIKNRTSFHVASGVARAVTIAGAAGAMHPGRSTRRPRIATFYCKIFSLKAQVNLLLLNVTLDQ